MSLVGGWTNDSDGGRIGPELGYKRDEKILEAFAGYNEYVETGEVHAALERAFTSGTPADANVKADYRVGIATMRPANSMT
jgi:thiamine pyrophosphate-dependent acetolactate synthase large subunit-like protein